MNPERVAKLDALSFEWAPPRGGHRSKPAPGELDGQEKKSHEPKSSDSIASGTSAASKATDDK